jgi:flagellar basal-body rod protein FlgB
MRAAISAQSLVNGARSVRIDDIPLFAALKGRLQYLNQRQRVISENVANADVPGFTPKDVRPPSFAQLLAHAQGGPQVATLTATEPGHLTTPKDAGAPQPFKSITTPDSETRMDGNSVVLEEEMLKMAESRMAYEAAIGFYQHSLNMIRVAAKKPGAA